jgi:hypothetical protein
MFTVRHILQLHRRGTIKVMLLEEVVSFGDATQFASGEKLRPFFGRTLMPSVLDKAFKGEL